jgi:hypothetical protein
VIPSELWIGGAAAFVVAGCASFNPVPIDQVGFLERSQTQQQRAVSVTAAVPSAYESKQALGVDMYIN